MKKIIIPAFLIATSFFYYSCENMDQISKGVSTANDILNQEGGNGDAAKPSLTNGEIVSGLKEALMVGIKNGAGLASKEDGFFKDPIIKIPFPQEAAAVEEKARKWGMGGKVDQFVVTLNRAAEEASKESVPIFVNAIKSMSIADAMGILRGDNNAATSYLKKTTTTELDSKFNPVVHNAIEKVEVTKYWNPVITKYNMIPGVEKKNPDLDDYVTKKALTGLFHLVEKEESKIRKDPAARVSDILTKVFGHVFEN